MPHPPTILAATVHDPNGRLITAIPRLAGPLRDVFAGIALNISDATHPDLIVLLGSMATLITHPTSLATVGRARRDSLALALQQPAGQIIYSDFDHMLRWIDDDPAELSAILATQPGTDLLVVGRSPRAFATEPARLRDTEAPVNRTYEMITGRRADIMFAVRRFNRLAAELIVRESSVDTLANDADWPLLAERAGLAVGYAESDALYYRTMDEFGAPSDTGDDDPENWIARIELAALHASAMRKYLKPR